MNKEVAGYIEKARDNLSAAKSLMKDGYYNIAASRAYYVMFYCAKALLQNEGFSFSKHSAVISAFGKYFAKTAKLDVVMHRYLLDAFQERAIADYNAVERVSEVSAGTMISQAEEFFDAASRYLEKPK